MANKISKKRVKMVKRRVNRATKRASKRSTVMWCEIKSKKFAFPLASVEGIADLTEVIAIPGNASRAVQGFAYITGQIMTVVDIAPIFNLGTSPRSKDVIVLRAEKSYYALPITKTGAVLTDAPTHTYSRPPSPFSDEYCEIGTDKIPVISVSRLIENICK